MLVKLYWSAWSAFVLVAMILLLTGNVSPLTLVVFGFVAFGLTFLGMMNVLPSVMAHPVAMAETPVEMLGASSRAPVPIRDGIVATSMGKTTHPPVGARAH